MSYFSFDNDYRSQGYYYLVGVDEAGRGPLAGPVVAAAVVLPPFFNDERIKDSKALSGSTLKALSDLIKEVALDYAIASASPQEIDELNIYQASRVAMMRAIKQLEHEYNFILTDAMPLLSLPVGHDALIKGDSKSLSIAAASILAKVERDEIMVKMDAMYPHYDFKNNKGYPTKTHLKALDIYGPIVGIHRYSYRPVQMRANVQIKLF